VAKDIKENCGLFGILGDVEAVQKTSRVATIATRSVH